MTTPDTEALVEKQRAAEAIGFFVDLVKRQREGRANMVAVDLVTAEYVVDALAAAARAEAAPTKME